MKIHDLDFDPIDRVCGAEPEEISNLITEGRRPVIFGGCFDLASFALDNLCARLERVFATQPPSADGVNTVTRFHSLPTAEFVDRIRRGDDLYIASRQILGLGGVRTDKHGLGALADLLSVPSWISPQRISTANLWAGGGNNKTVLHYDPWDGVLLLFEGRKDFCIFPASDTARMQPYGPFDLKALHEGKILHSKISPTDIQPQYQSEIRKAKGVRGTLQAGEAIFIPAGFWHYVESQEINVAINFFLNLKNRRLHFTEPLKTYWIKDRVTLWPIRLAWMMRASVAPAYRRFFPKLAD